MAMASNVLQLLRMNVYCMRACTTQTHRERERERERESFLTPSVMEHGDLATLKAVKRILALACTRNVSATG